MNVGDYVRTEDGTITRIKMFYEKKWEDPELIYARFLCEDYEIYEYPRQTKTSPNIIDLIEVGDYVNGMKVTNIQKDLSNNVEYVFGYSREGFEGETMYYDDDIKSIVTKECFESMEYKVKE